MKTRLTVLLCVIAVFACAQSASTFTATGDAGRPDLVRRGVVSRP